MIDFTYKDRNVHRLPVCVFTAGLLSLLILTARAEAASTFDAQRITQTGLLVPVYLNFRDLTLVDAQRAGIAASPDVAAAKAKVAQAEATLRQVIGTAYPTLAVGYAQQPQGNPPGPSLPSRLTSAGLQITLGDLTSAVSAKRVAAFTLAAAQADEKAAEATERVKISRLYFDALIAASTASARYEALSLARDQTAIAQKRFAAGDAPRLDIIRSQAAVLSAQSDLATAQADDANAIDALRIEAGLPDNSSLPLYAISNLSAVTTDLMTGRLTPENAVAIARRQRPEIVSAELSERAATVNIRAARANAIPNIVLSAGYGTGTDSGVVVRGPVANFQMLLPLAPLGRVKVATAEASELEAIAKSASISRSVLTEVAATTRSLLAAYVTRDSSTAALNFAAQDLRGMQIGFRNGASTQLELATARNAYIQSKITAQTAIYNLQKLHALFDIGVGN